MHQVLRTLLAVLFMLGGGLLASAQTPSFTASSTSGCAPLLVTFYGSYSGTAPSSWTWNLGTGTSALQNPAISYNSPGTYSVTLTLNGPGGPSITKTNYITVYPPPVINFTYNNTSGCPPLAVAFTSTVTPGVPGPVSYSWDYGDGSPYGSGANSSHTYTASNLYTVTLSATNSAGCVASKVLSNIIDVYPKPSGAFYANPTVYCSAPATVSFQNTVTNGTGPYTVTWDFGDGNQGSGNNPVHTYNGGGQFTVKLKTVDANGCVDTVSQYHYITVHTPSATFSGPGTLCDTSGNPSTLAVFTNTTAGATTTSWDFGDGNAATGNAVSNIYYDTLSYTIRMITSVSGCPDTAYKTVKVHANPVVTGTFSPYPNCPSQPATFTYTASGASTYTWSYSTGFGPTSGNPVTKTFPHPPLWDTVTIVGTDGNGCVDSGKMYVPVFDVFGFYLGPINGCTTDTFAMSLAPDSFLHTGVPAPWMGIYPSKVVSFYWDFGDGSTPSTAAAPTHIYGTPGNYMRVCTVVLANGCIVHDTSIIHVGIKVHPSFFASPNPVCAGQLVYFHNTTTANPFGGVVYTWDVGDGAYTVVNNRDATHYYFAPGTYTVILYADNNGCVDSTKITNYMTVNGPNANFTDTVLCTPDRRTVHFNNMSIGTTSVLWKYGNNVTSTTFSPLYTYPVAGTYLVTLITFNSATGCSDTLSLPVVVGPPVMSFTAQDTTVCVGDTLRLIGSYTGTPASLSWEITGPGNFYKADTGYTTAARLVTTGRYTVSFMGMANLGGCRDTIKKINYIVVSKPTAYFSSSPLFGCTPLTVTFTDTSKYTPLTGPGTRSWWFGDGGTATGTGLTTSHTYYTARLDTVRLIVTDWNGCADTLTKPGYIRTFHPSASFTSNKVLGCIGESFNFNNTSTGASVLGYNWDFGDGSTSILTNPSHSYAAAGPYNIRLIATDSLGCSDTLIVPAAITITRPTAAFSMSDTLAVCPPLHVNFTNASVNAVSYAWTFGNSGVSVLTNPQTTYSSSGLYTVLLVAKDINGCTDTARAKARVLGYAGALAYTPLAGCVPLTVNFTSTISNVAYVVWDFSDGDTARGSGAPFSHTYVTPGAYVPKIIFFDGSGCSASSVGTDTIKVDAVFAGFKVMPPCERSPVMLVDTSHSLFSPLFDWQWSFGGSTLVSGQSVPHTFPSPGQYPVTLIVTNARGCKDTLSRNVTIYPLPIITGSPDTVVCVPDAVAIYATGGVSYTWAPGATLSCTSCLSPNASPTVPTTYIVTGTDSIGCANRDSIKIGIQTKTSFTVASGGEICLGQHFNLIAGGATIYSWTPSASLDNSNAAAPIATPTVTTTYIATAREGSCAVDTHSVKVIVNPLPTVDAGTDERVIAGGSVELQASGTGIDHLLWKMDTTLSCTTCFAPYASPKTTTVYYVTAYTAKGCAVTDSVTVRVLCDGSQLFIPNTFTPNGDGLNDYFYAEGRGLNIINSFRVYSRWGELLFERTNMAVNDQYAGWNGTYGGQKLSPDVYVYIIEATCDNGSPIKWKGDVTLIR